MPSGNLEEKVEKMNSTLLGWQQESQKRNALNWNPQGIEEESKDQELRRKL
jgi:hypothetical protein